MQFGWLNLTGAFIVVLMMIPNLIYARRKPHMENKCRCKPLLILQQVGRCGYEAGKISIKGQTVAFKRCAAPASDFLGSDVLFFFDGKPDKLALYESLDNTLTKAVPEFTIKVQKSQISIYNRHLFAMVSLPRRKSESGIVVSFGLGHRLDSSRVAVATEPYPGRWTHHVPVTDAAQLDDELLGWLRESYDFSAAKL